MVLKSLKVIFEEIGENEEEQIVVKYRQMRPDLLQSISEVFGDRQIGTTQADSAKSDELLLASSGPEVFRLKPSEILYIESIDRKTFMYCEERVYESAQKLRELEELLRKDDFLRTSRTMLVNINNIRSFFPVLAGQLGATMLNGEKIVVTRRYIDDVRTALGYQKRGGS